MRYIFLLPVFFLAGCDSGSFDKDKRQIIAKNRVLSHLPPRASNLTITAFKEDTLRQSVDTVFKKPIVYTIDYRFNDSTGKSTAEKAAVVFTPDGNSVITLSVQPQ